ncbi:MAG: DUF4412 domain-containing protein [Kiritimatiellaeota bacterium]|nr:DUF4412 domain-containing protein [Kiritimatiellota bacterium]
MQKQWLVTIGAVATASLLQAQGPGGMGGVWAKYQDKLTPVHEYSATMVMEVGGQAINTKMFKSGQKVRTEISMQGMQAITITDPDAENGKGVMYTLMPAMKTYMKMPIPADVASKADDDKTDIKIDELGKEDVDGVSCDKRRVTITVDGKAQVMTMWASPKDKNMPVKIEMVTPAAVVIRFKDYDFKKPTDDLFKVPADYKGSDMGQMMNVPRN